MGFTVTGPGTYLSSGHPAPGEDLPNPLGLVETRDGGTTWTPLSLTGEVDFHALDVSQGTVFGYDATNERSAARQHRRRTQLRSPVGSAARVPLVGPDGVVHGLDTGSTVFASRDGGSTWQQAGKAPGGRPQAITATDDVLLVATAGGVYRSDDGRTFASVG